MKIGSGILPAFKDVEAKKDMTLREIMDRLQQTYCADFPIVRLRRESMKN